MVTGGVSVEELAAAHLQAACFGMDERAGRVTRINAMDVAVREADFAAAFDVRETDSMCRVRAAEQSAGRELEWRVIGGSTMMSP